MNSSTFLWRIFKRNLEPVLTLRGINVTFVPVVSILQVRSSSYNSEKRINLSWKYKKTGHFKTRLTASNSLLDGPDYTFLDGRPTPMRSGQKRRALDQKEIITKAFTLKKEVDFAKEHFAKMTRDEKAERQKVIESKLKEKGNLLEEYKR